MKRISKSVLILAIFIAQGCTTSSQSVRPESDEIGDKITLSTFKEIQADLQSKEAHKFDNYLKHNRDVSLQTYLTTLNHSFDNVDSSIESQQKIKKECEGKKFDNSSFKASALSKFPGLKKEAFLNAVKYIAFNNLYKTYECMRPAYADSVYNFVEFKYYIRTLAEDLRLANEKNQDPFAKEVFFDVKNYSAFLEKYKDDRLSGLSQQHLYAIESQTSGSLDAGLKKWLDEGVLKEAPFNPESIEVPQE